MPEADMNSSPPQASLPEYLRQVFCTKPADLAWLTAIVLLAVLVRLPASHLLMWDEAINLLSVRAFAAGGQDFYSGQFWHHPPLLFLLLSGLAPLSHGFAERASLLMVLLSVGNLLLLYLLVHRTWGPLAARWSAFFLAVMPAAVFYDRWIKQDSLVTFFGLAALWLFLERRTMFAGALLALAFLSKETAVIFAAAVFVCWLLRPPGTRQWRDLAWVTAMPVFLASWWYLLFSGTVGRFWMDITQGVRVSSQSEAIWTEPRLYYFAKLPLDLGWSGTLLLLAGITALTVVAFACWRQPVTNGAPEDRGRCLWPAVVLVAGFAILTVSRSKAPWFCLSLLPPLAAMEGIGLSWLLARLPPVPEAGSGATPLLRRRWCQLLLAGLAMSGPLSQVPWDYEAYMRTQSAALWWGATASREAALTMNACIGDEEPTLLTSMYYWRGGGERPCPVLVYYLKPLPVVVRTQGLSLAEVTSAIRDYGVRWLMLSLPYNPRTVTLVDTLRAQYGEPRILKGVLLFHAAPHTPTDP